MTQISFWWTKLTHDKEYLDQYHDVHPQIVTIAEMENIEYSVTVWIECLPGLHVPDRAPVGGEEVTSDYETNEVADHDDTDDEVEVDELRCEYEHYIRSVFCPQEASISTHIGEDRTTGPVSIYQSCQ